ncbi:MAG: hypothetical protein KIT72_18540 [Polyangiaceae bacterium]|nr:hypothetical protein [Polyangiaceae bacterium]MCW5792417.1 hypothetical protein [Polyangiaceae bacterium]
MSDRTSLLRRASAFLVLGVSAWGLAVACSTTEPGITVTLALSPVEQPSLEPEVGRRFETDLGYQVHLREGFVVLEHLEVYRCDGAGNPDDHPHHGHSLGFHTVKDASRFVSRDAARLAVKDAAARFSAWLAPKPAFAHSTGTAERLAAPIVVDLLSPSGAPWELGELALRPGAYCAFQHSLGPADADAERLTAPSQVGQSLWLSLEVSGGGLSEPLLLELGSDEVFEGFYDLPRLELGEDRREAMIHIVHHGEHWFDHIDFAESTSDRVLQRFWRNFRDSVEVMWH